MKERNLIRWEPFRDLVSLRDDFDRLLENFFGRGPIEKEEFWAPVMDVVESNGNIEVKAELPGMKKEDIKVTVKDNILSVSGERKQEKETKDKTFHRIERYYGKFCRSIELPSEVDPDKVKATYKDGVLNITLPKPESAKPKQIEVEVK
ncbi:MAG TPA: Hsp20/alpha crystallin family protein [candidate division WOR-3 bacterium]|uniref:Hsp20/alpha crystallin family protein n=1 Tax=candidate division WOR-3 bacterium TaxID=2052148 RepID=A0A9C9K0Q3_UNCW3|nr:Hsp20/alpha crystallin family protein [candidate division WOR-3 bacterium]